MGDRRADRGDEPNLELPSIFGRRRRRETEEPTPAAEPERPVVQEPAPVAEDTAPPAPPTYDAAPPAPPTYDTAGQNGHGRVRTAQPAEAPEPAAEPVTGGARRAPRTARPALRLPAQLTLVLTGLLVGLAGSLLTWGSLAGCEAVRGTSSCGGGPGLLLLVVIFVVMVALGAGLLRALGVADARSTSLLAVGLLAVVVMVVLMNAVFSSWMFVAVPVVGAAAYVLAGWVTTRLVETTEDGPEHDVR